MKKIYFLSVLLLVISSPNFAQLMQASIGQGSTPNRAKIYLKSSVTIMSNISTLEFNVGIPESVTPKPTMAVISTVFSGVTWVVSDHPNADGYYNYVITKKPAIINYQLTANTEFEALEVEFSGGGVIPSISLVTLPDGGTYNGLALFLCTGGTGSPQSDGSNLYYARTGTTVDNKFSYDLTGGTPGTSTSTATFSPEALPIKISAFNINKNNKDALLNWSVENQDAQSSRFEIERSYDGTKFENIGSVNLAGNLSNQYSYTDNNISASNLNSVVYYRLKMIDKDGLFTYSDIKTIRLNGKGLSISMYPNPVRNLSKLSLDLDRASIVKITIKDALGKQVRRLEFNGQKGLNQKDINLSGLSAGSYMIRVQADNRIKTIQVIKD